MNLPARSVLLQAADALIVVDVQRDFLPGGALAVPHGDDVVPVLNRYVRLFGKAGLPIIFSRDWHPYNHGSFRGQGGPWPVHCVAESPGADFAPGLEIRSGQAHSEVGGYSTKCQSCFGGRRIPNFAIRDSSVVGLMPRR